MSDINKLTVLEAFTKLGKISWSDFTEIFPTIKGGHYNAQRLSIIIKELEDEHLIRRVKNKNLTWSATLAAFDRYKQLISNEGEQGNSHRGNKLYGLNGEAFEPFGMLRY